MYVQYVCKKKYICVIGNWQIVTYMQHLIKLSHKILKYFEILIHIYHNYNLVDKTIKRRKSKKYFIPRLILRSTQ